VDYRDLEREAWVLALRLWNVVAEIQPAARADFFRDGWPRPHFSGRAAGWQDGYDHGGHAIYIDPATWTDDEAQQLDIVARAIWKAVGLHRLPSAEGPGGAVGGSLAMDSAVRRTLELYRTRRFDGEPKPPGPSDDVTGTGIG